MNKIINIFSSILQIIIIAGIFSLELLSKKKAGVNHHLIARKYQLQEGLFNSDNIMLLCAIIFIITLAVIFLSIKQKKITLIKINFIIVGAFFILASNYELIKGLNSYIYILSGTIIIFTIQFLIILIDYVKKR